MTVKAEARRPQVGARRIGYAVAVLVNVALLYTINAWPGWEAVPFLTEDLRLVTGLVNASIVVNWAARRFPDSLVANFTLLLVTCCEDRGSLGAFDSRSPSGACVDYRRVRCSGQSVGAPSHGLGIAHG